MAESPKSLILLAHEGLSPITDERMLEAIPDDWKLIPREVVHIKLEIPEQVEFLSWGSVRREQRRQCDDKLKPVLSGHPDSLLVYFGTVPIPLALDLGVLVGSWKKIHVFLHHHDTKNWHWPGGDEPELCVEDMPSDRLRSKGDIAIRVFSSVEIEEPDIYDVVPDVSALVTLRTKETGWDVFSSFSSLKDAANRFRKLIQELQDKRPNHGGIHLFLAGPVGLAFMVGAAINKTMISSLWSYKFNRSSTPRYAPAFDLLRDNSQILLLREEDRKQAASVRRMWGEELKKLATFAKHNARKQSKDWLSSLDLGSEMELEGRWGSLVPIGDAPAIQHKLVEEHIDGIDGFRYLDKKWWINDELLCSLIQRFGEDEERLRKSARLLFLHETIHFACQGMTSSNARGVGRNHPQILEEADYIADVWGFIHELSFCEKRGIGAFENPAEFFRQTIFDALESFVAFDLVDGSPRRQIQIRRLRRYLIWYWQYLRLGKVKETNDELKNSLDILFFRPLVNLSGPKTLLGEQGRVYYDLITTPSLLEFAVLHGVKIRRFGTSEGVDLHALLSAFNEFDNKKALGVVRSVFDSLA